MSDERESRATDGAASPRALAVLHVEDSNEDGLLIAHELRRAGYALLYERVETAEAMAAALERQRWDVVLSDHDMPCFSAPAALQVVQRSGCDLPFIVVTGALGEEFAAGLMKAGAHDFIKKSNLARLVPAIERELHEAASREQRRRAEAALKASEERLQLAVEGARLGLWDFEVATGLSSYSEGWKRMLGYGDDLTGTFEEWNTLVHPDDRERLESTAWCHLRKTSRPSTPYEVEFRLRHKDGSWRWILSRAKVLLDDEGRALRMIGAHVDITERKRTEEALRESEARYRILFDNAPDAAAVVDADLRVLMVNERAAALFGFDAPEEMIGRSGFDFIAPEELAHLRSDLARVLAGGGPSMAEWTVVSRTGERCTVEAMIAAVPDREGQPRTLLAVGRDITERKRAEAALRESEERYRKLVERSRARRRP